MKNFKATLILSILWNVGCSQTSLELTQGYWKEDTEELQSYVVVENHHWYSITVLDGEADVSVEWFGFYDNFEADSIHPSDLSSTGNYVVFLIHRKSIDDYNTHLERGYFNFYEYDLDERYFTYYANEPVIFDKINSLPEDIHKKFEKAKQNLPSLYVPNDKE